MACQLLVALWYLVPWPGVSPGPLRWESLVLATGPPGKSPAVISRCCGNLGFVEKFLELLAPPSCLQKDVSEPSERLLPRLKPSVLYAK